MNKKYYKITISGESLGECYRMLDDEQYELINSIFDECSSEYVGGSIEEADRKYVVELWEEINEKHTKHPSRISMLGYRIVVNPDKYYNYDYPSYPNIKHFHYFFDTKEDALDFCQKESERLGCEILTICERNETI